MDNGSRKETREALRSGARFAPERFREAVRSAILPLVDAYEDPAPPEVDAVRSGRFMEACRAQWKRAMET